MRWLSIITFLSISFISLAQQIEIDSLLQQHAILEGEKKVNNLVNITRYYFLEHDSLALTYGNEAIHLANEIGFIEGIGKIKLFLALWHDDYDNDKAIRYYHDAISIFEEFNDPWIVYCYNNLCRIYREKGWLPEALEISIKSLKMAEAKADSAQLAIELTTMGYIYYRMHDYKEALVWQKKALPIALEYCEPKHIGLVYGRIGIIYDELELFDSAHIFNNIALKYFKEAGEDHYLATWYSNIGNTFIKQGKVEEAETYFNQALELNKHEFEQTIILINLGQVYILTGRYKKAEDTLNKAIRLGLQNEQVHFLSEAYFRKFELAQKLGNLSTAIEYFKKHHNLNDSILNIEKTEQIAQMRVRYETEQKEKQLLIEKAEKETIAKEKALAEIKVYNRNKWIIGISSLTLIVIFFSLFIFQRKKRKIQFEKDAAIIYEREKGLKAVISAQEEERKRIAKDLHDGIGQQLTGLKLAWQHLESILKIKFPEEEEKLTRLTVILDEAAADVRTISHEMMPRVLSEAGLVPAIEDMLSKSLGTANINYKFETFKVENRFAENIEISLYRVLQELINNIIKHAGALLVSVQLFTNKGFLILIVEDNGKGFEFTDNSEGHGLLNIKSRMNAIHGDVSYNPSPGSGTVATVRVPVD
ncbi:MAG: sensor histidine kinase [Bacteroidales bacterium]